MGSFLVRSLGVAAKTYPFWVRVTVIIHPHQYAEDKLITRTTEGQMAKSSRSELWSELRPVPEWAVRWMFHPGLGFCNNE